MGDTYFMDLEYSSSPGNPIGSIISIGLISLDGRMEIRQLIKPGKKIRLSDWCTRITGIKREDLIDCPRLKDAYGDIFGKINKDDIIYVWGNDGEILEGSAKSRGIPFCLNIVDYQQKLKDECSLFWSPGLRKTMKAMGLRDEYNHHDSLEDAKMLRDIYVSFENGNDKEDHRLKIRKAEYIHRLEQLMTEYTDVVENL